MPCLCIKYDQVQGGLEYLFSEVGELETVGIWHQNLETPLPFFKGYFPPDGSAFFMDYLTGPFSYLDYNPEEKDPIVFFRNEHLAPDTYSITAVGYRVSFLDHSPPKDKMSVAAREFELPESTGCPALTVQFEYEMIFDLAARTFSILENGGQEKHVESCDYERYLNRSCIKYAIEHFPALDKALPLFKREGGWFNPIIETACRFRIVAECENWACLKELNSKAFPLVQFSVKKGLLNRNGKTAAEMLGICQDLLNPYWVRFIDCDALSDFLPAAQEFTKHCENVLHALEDYDILTNILRLGSKRKKFLTDYLSLFKYEANPEKVFHTVLSKYDLCADAFDAIKMARRDFQ